MNPTPWPDQADPAARWLAEGFVTHLKRWVAESAPDSPALSRALDCARHLSLATSAGHVCLPLELDDLRLAQDHADASSRAQQLSQDLLSTRLAIQEGDDAAAPMVLDDKNRLYLTRYFELERRLAIRVVRAAQQTWSEPDPLIVRTLAGLFDTHPDDSANHQFAAARMALTRGLSIISGGPGTGKTTTVVNLLCGLLMQNSGLRIALAAPTGKAAARMLEAISARAATLPPDLRERLPTEASTIHRLIGIHPREGLADHHAGAPLPIDALVIDEASMLDLALATQLLEAVPDHARIILLGDKDQLAAVEAGAVFAELSSLRDSMPSCIVWFTRNFRFSEDSGIGQLAQTIRAGQACKAQQVLKSECKALDRVDAEDHQRIQQGIETGFQPYLRTLERVLREPLQDAVAPILALHQALLSFRVLCALRQGPQGVEQLNARISAWLQRSPAGAPRHIDPEGWHPGRVIMITRNDQASGLFNGDIGIALPDAGHHLKVFFAPSVTATAVASQVAPSLFRSLPVERLPEHETAFAMTIHKSQGSEFDEVLLMLAPEDSPILGRELLYTGVTRAREKVTIVGSVQALNSALDQPTRRFSGLADRIRHALQNG